MKNKFAFIVGAVAVVVALTASATKPESKIAQNSILLTKLPYADPAWDQNGTLANGDPPLPGDTPIYEDNVGLCDHHYPITAPGGHQLTLAEWQTARGEAHIQCREGGSEVRVKLKGLVPNGVYSIWVGVFDAPDLANIIGLGALGSPDGSQNHFVASAEGTGEVSVVEPAGALSVFGQVTNCLLNEAEVLLWPGLHLDGQTHGPSPGDECQLSFAGSFSFAK